MDGAGAAAGSPIVVLTADGRAPEQAWRVGAITFLRKPFGLDDLLTVAARFLPAR